MSGWQPPTGPPVTGVVAFNYQFWIARYPEFASVQQNTAWAYFQEACLYLNNSGSSPVRDCSPYGARAKLLNMLTAHIAQLNAPLPSNGESSPQIVGRVSNASEGAVSVALEFADTQARDQWYNQTKYGTAYLAAIQPYIMGGRFKRGPRPYLGVGLGAYRRIGGQGF